MIVLVKNHLVVTVSIQQKQYVFQVAGSFI